MTSGSERDVGPFRLEVPLARGGSGQVWRGRHRRSGVAVALKLLRAGSDDFQRASMEVEVVALAALDHPHILRILGQGRTERAIGELPPHTPWIATELVEGGTLAQRAPSMRWPALQVMLEQVLDGLAHAHAHGVLHRDLKPGNLLWADGLRPGWKLGDFGLALGSHTPRDHHGATLSYAAPEQLAADAHQGPWTDLYALAATAWHVVTGFPPFVGQRDAVARAHVEQAPPAFAPRFEVPDGLELWLRQLLSKRGEDRPALAADALALLRGFVTDAGGSDDETLEVPVEAVPARRAQLRSWRQLGAARRAPMEGVGSELFALRAPPMVGREAERDALWALLEQVHGDRKPAVGLVVGPQGIGATRLCRWVGLRAAELGLARFVHLPAGSEAARILTALRGEPGVPVDRPVVLLVDDVVDLPWVLRQALRLLGGASWPVLLLLTAEHGALQQAPAIDEVWVSLAGHRRAAEVALGPLPNAALDELLDAMLPLGPALRAEVRVRSRGLPGLLMQVLRDSLEAGILVGGEEGLVCAAGQVLAPVTGLALRRLEALWAELDPAGHRGLVALAVLGDGVDLVQWQRVQPTNQGLVVTLLRLGHVTVVGQRLRFVDPAFAEAVLAKGGDVSAVHARAAAVSREDGAPGHVVGRHLLGAGRADEAVAWLLDGAGDLHLFGDTAGSVVALELAREGLEAAGAPDADPRWVEYWRSRCASMARGGAAGHAAAAGRRAVRLARASHDPELLVRCLRALAAALVMSGQVARAEEVLGEAVATLPGAPELSARVHAQLCELYNATGQHHRVVAAAEHALAHAHRYPGSTDTTAWVLHHLGYALFRLGRTEEAQARVDEARVQAEGRPVLSAHLHSVAGDIARGRGDLDAAEAAYEQAVEGVRPLAAPDIAVFRLNLAMVSCRRRRWEEAIERSEQARLDLVGVAWATLVAYAHALQLWPLAALERWPAFDRAMEEARGAADRGCTDVDIVELLTEVLGVLASKHALRRARVERLRDRFARGLPGSPQGPSGDAAGS